MRGNGDKAYCAAAFPAVPSSMTRRMKPFTRQPLRLRPRPPEVNATPELERSLIVFESGWGGAVTVNQSGIFILTPSG